MIRQVMQARRVMGRTMLQATASVKREANCGG
jgi:hypothetical protein